MLPSAPRPRADGLLQVDLHSRMALVVGPGEMIVETIAAAMTANGASVSVEPVEAATARGSDQFAAVDFLVIVHELRPDGAPSAAALPHVAATAGIAMAARGSGRIVHILSALGLIPMRRHREQSVAMAGAIAEMRTLAMTLGAEVRVNAICLGAIAAPPERGGDFIAGSEAMLSHVPLARPGTLQDIANAVLFLCDPLNSYMTGQVLTIDGGWAAGYARNF
ncbi:MAG: SDR family oxidoreductase [Methylobacteriaceae bacterium]|nr:SDR family oxidoreductase [Methylobacteriaceae bacterium]